MNAPAPSAGSTGPAAAPTATADTPLSSAEFERLMAAVAPFERAPHLLVAVSGGADSVALALLADEWCRARHGAVLAVTVDHGMRPGSAAEARQVATWLRRRDIDHRIVRWRGKKPRTGVQAAARHARYGLLAQLARQEGILHLLAAHHADDQAETFLMRLERGSGVAGLAGMAAVTAMRDVRLLRPLLPVPKARLIATLKAVGQEWAEDPSNRDLRYLRSRLRRQLASLEDLGLGGDKFCAVAATMAELRESEEREMARALAAVVWIAPDGRGVLDRHVFERLSDANRRRVVARIVTVVGGNAYEPGSEKLDRLVGAMMDPAWRGATIAHCRLTPSGGAIYVVREAPRRVGVSRDSSMGYNDVESASGAGLRPITALCECRLYLVKGDS